MTKQRDFLVAEEQAQHAANLAAAEANALVADAASAPPPGTSGVLDAGVNDGPKARSTTTTTVDVKAFARSCLEVRGEVVRSQQSRGRQEGQVEFMKVEAEVGAG
jgi:hypothetical protein